MIYNYAMVMSALDPTNWGTMPTGAELVELEEKWARVSSQLIAKATLISDPECLVHEARARAAASDVAGVREGADAPADAPAGAQAGGAGAPAGEGGAPAGEGASGSASAGAKMPAEPTEFEYTVGCIRGKCPTAAETLAGTLRGFQKAVANAAAGGDSEDEGEPAHGPGGGPAGDGRGEGGEPRGAAPSAGPAGAPGAGGTPAAGGAGAAAAGAGAPAAAASPPRIEVPRSDEPVNEFTHGARLLHCAHWYNLPAAEALPTAASDGVHGLDGVARHRAPALKHLLRQHTGAFGQDKQLLLVLMNQHQRHCAAREVCARWKDSPEAMAALAELVSEPGFKERCAEAVKNPTGTDAKRLLADIMPHIRQAGKGVPYSAVERQEAITTIMGMARIFGCPSVYLTGARTRRASPRRRRSTL